MQQPGYGLLLFFCGLICTTTAGAVNNHAHHPQADTDSAQHHNHHDADLRLNQGKKWETDKALRDGMKNIRSATDNAMRSAHASPEHHLDKQQAVRLAEQVNQQVEHIFAECKLSAEADAVLHGLLADMLQATQLLKHPGGSDRHSVQQVRLQALLSLQKSLALYPQYFNDSEWHTD